MSSNVRITFGMIVLNGEPFLRYNLHALYPFAHQIIVVEGACVSAREFATSDGHSIDTTLETLRQFKEKEDLDGKLTIITAEDEGHNNGFWTEKDEMSRAYTKRATGNYLWQIDVDEFYFPEDMQKVIGMLENNPKITAISFPILSFWGGINYILDGYAFRTHDHRVDRVFAWKPGYQYISHRPPTVVDYNGRDLKTLYWISKEKMHRMGIRMYHYDMLLPKQAEQKSIYYSKADWHKLDSVKIRDWASNFYYGFKDPYHIYNMHIYYNWLKRYKNDHPPQISLMISHIKADKYPDIVLRQTNDIEKLLLRYSYRIKILILLYFIIHPQVQLHRIKLFIRKILLKTPFWPILQFIKSSLIPIAERSYDI